MHTVKDIMTPNIPVININSEITDVVATLRQHNLFAAPGTNSQQQLVGFISEQQLLAPLLQNSYFCDGKVTVKELMRKDVVSVTESMNIVDLAQQMQGNQPKVYPVVKGNIVTGVVTRSQVVDALKQDYLSCSAH